MLAAMRATPGSASCEFAREKWRGGRAGRMLRRRARVGCRSGSRCRRSTSVRRWAVRKGPAYSLPVLEASSSSVLRVPSSSAAPASAASAPRRRGDVKSTPHASSSCTVGMSPAAPAQPCSRASALAASAAAPPPPGAAALEGAGALGGEARAASPPPPLCGVDAGAFLRKTRRGRDVAAARAAASTDRATGAARGRPRAAAVAATSG